MRRPIILVLLSLLIAIPALSQAPASNPKPLVPQPAIPAILAAFDHYEVVGMSEAHGMKDTDDFILALVRNPSLPDKVNDIVVECGNSRYQPILDRYIAGEDVPFTEVQKTWRDTTQVMCSLSGFFEQLYPLVRAINQKLPPEKRLRVLASDPPIDWDQVKTFQDYTKIASRDASIASVMEKEVLDRGLAKDAEHQVIGQQKPIDPATLKSFSQTCLENSSVHKH